MILITGGFRIIIINNYSLGGTVSNDYSVDGTDCIFDSILYLCV